MLIESVAICITILLISYRRHRFDFRPFKWLPLLFVGFLVELIAVQLIKGTHYNSVIALTFYIQIIIYACLFSFVLKNVKYYKTIVVLGFGFLLNAIVIFANNSRMPVDTAMAINCGFTESLKLLNKGLIFGHQTMTSAVNLPFLADVISIYPPYPRPQTLSIGDIIIDIGLILLTIEQIRTARKV